MKKRNTFIYEVTFAGLLFAFTGVQADLELTDEPLYLNQSVPPALAITFDDSGSMAWGFMPSGRSYTGDGRSTASTDYNEIYYDPTIEYKPPVRSDGSSFPNSSYTAAQFDGFYLGGNTSSDLGELIDLSDDYEMVWESYPNYSSGDASTSFLSASKPGTEEGYYYTWNGPGAPTRDGAAGTGAGQYTLTTLNSATAQEQQNFANWYTYYNTRGKLAKSAVSHAFVNFGPDFKIDWQQLNSLSYNASGQNVDLFVDGHRDDFYDWLYSIPASGGTPLRLATQRAGELFKQGGPTDTDSPYYDDNFGAELACQQNFHIAISDGGWNSAAGTSTNSDNVNTSFPALDSTGVNLVYNYTPNDSSSASSMYAGSQADTLADKAFDYWRQDLRSNLANQVPAFIEDYTDRSGATVVIPDGEQWWQQSELFWNPSNDPATWQHMVNFNIGLGVFGSLDPAISLAGIRDGSITWPGTGATGGKIDDVWHASLNSRGKFFSAKDPAELSTALNKVVSNIITRKGRSSAGSVSSNVISSNSLAYKAGFDTSDWSGFVVASELNFDGSFGAALWDAGCKLTGGVCAATGTVVSASNTPSSRNIITYLDGVKYDFISGILPASNLIDFVDTDIDFFAENVSSISTNMIIDYIRGDRSNEIQNGGILRDRRSVLGDVIHSTAQLIRGPSAGYSDDVWPVGSVERIAADNGYGYEYYKQANRSRNSVLLVGANDGMLHAFGAGLNNANNGGDELWAYIPSTSFAKLSELVVPSYEHTTFVDAAPFVKDVYINSNWKTVALGHLRHGGKLFYALDLDNDPEAEPDVLWEFTDSDGDLGYSYAGGIITRVFNPVSKVSKWVAILPNGYDSDNNNAVMYAVDLETGHVLHKWIETGGSSSSPNGMGPPVAADFVAYNPTNPTETFFAADQATDFIYAGDLHGNLYRFDAQDIFSNSTTTAQKIFNGTIDQPITTAPRVFTPNDTTEDVVITFGTGKYIEVSDRSVATDSQYLFGIRDSYSGYSAYSLNDSRLVTQTITQDTSAGTRTVSRNQVNSNQGWKLELPDQGERIVNNLIRNNRSKLMFAVSIIPTGLNPCLPGGQSWVMAINAITGAGPSTSVFGSGGPGQDGVHIDDLVLGLNILVTPYGNSTVIKLDTTGSASSDSIEIDASNINVVWGRKSWHRYILD